MLQYPDVNGEIENWEGVTEQVHKLGGQVVVGTDLLALTMLKVRLFLALPRSAFRLLTFIADFRTSSDCFVQPPGEWGADMVLGNSARFGVPAGYGGPHAAFFSCRDGLKRKMPGRLIGLSKASNGEKAYRLALQSESLLSPFLASTSLELTTFLLRFPSLSSRAAHPKGESYQ